jgi:hypothetical protein
MLGTSLACSNPRPARWLGVMLAGATAGLIPCLSLSATGAPSFDHEVMAVLSRAGCNMGACHGNLNGKGGLQLSLRGQDPRHDYLALTHDAAGRRISRNDPEQSLALLKPTSEVPHQGGQRIRLGSREYDIVRGWIAAGTPGPDPQAARLQRLEVSPTSVVVDGQTAPSVQIVATAIFDDGTQRDVTELATYETSNFVASVGPSGRVERQRNGETTVAVRYLSAQVCVRIAFIPHADGIVGSALEPHNWIDTSIDRKLRQLQIEPAMVASETVLLRRLSLDILGRLPTALEAQEYCQDHRPDKRDRLLDRLLARPEFVDHWSLKWSDLLRNDEKLLDAKGVRVFHQWIRDCLAEDLPLDEFVRRLVAARGSTYEQPPANYYRALRDPLTRGETTAQLFLGVRLQCAKCHNHPFDVWTQDDYYNWAGVFARIEYEIIENNPQDKLDKQEFVGEQKVVMKDEGEVTNARTGEPATPHFLGADGAHVEAEQNRLEQLALWLTDPANRDFAQAQANRIWYHMMGRGLVDPIDDFRVTNPASHPELLDALARELVDSGYNLRHLIRLIASSRAYQASTWQDDQDTLAVDNYAGVAPRRLSAEQLLDAQCQVLGIPADFNGYPRGTRAMQLAGAQAVRARKNPPSDDDRFLATFGKPARLMSCECERSSETTLSQAFYLINGPALQQRIEHPNNRPMDWLNSGRDDRELVKQLFWTTLTRGPTDAELAACVAYLQSASSRTVALQDLVWATLNAKEFLFRP